MRLYVNTNEVPLLKDALGHAIAHANALSVAARLSDLLERVILCEERQQNVKRSAKE